MSAKHLFLLSCALPWLSANAVFGPALDDSARPHSVCALEFYSEHNPELIDEVCSVVVIGPNHALTAGHCLPGLPERRHRILCRDEQSTTIASVQANPDLDLARLRFEEDQHANDSAFLILNAPLDIEAMAFSQSREQTLAIIEETRECGIFGHGGFRESLRRVGLSTNAKIHPEQIIFDDELIRVQGYGGYNSGLVEPGDSGGSLACRDAQDQWVHLAQVSGRTMQATSLFAPIDKLEVPVSTTQTQSSAEARERSQRLQQMDLARELEACEKRWTLFVGRAFAATGDLQLDRNTCRQGLLSHARVRFEQGDELNVRVKPYSLIEIDQRAESLQLGGRPLDRYLNHPNPFSTVDHIYTRFNIRDIQGDYAVGDLTIFGYSESFACLHNILCDGGLLKNVRIRLEDLLLGER